MMTNIEPVSFHPSKPDVTSRSLAIGLAKFVVVTLCLGWLTGCLPSKPEAAANAETRYPLAAESQLDTQPVIFKAGKTELETMEKNRLDVFLAYYRQSGGGVLEIQQTADAYDPHAEKRMQAVRRHVMHSGAKPHEIRLRRITGTSAEGNLVILSFKKFTAKTYKCGQRNAQISPNPSKMQHPDMGCALRSNMAAIISNPADLERPSVRQPGSATRRARVIQNHHAGQPTESARGDGESASSIRDLGG